MYVKDHMTASPKTIAKDVMISKAVDIMHRGDFHRLPVVDGDNHLIGLITNGLIAENTGSGNTSLSIYELNYLLSKTTVEEIMIKDVRTVSPDAFLEEAADIMRTNEINCLPVTDEQKNVLGIITDKDIFQAFIELLGYNHVGTKFVIPCEDKPGEFARLTALFAAHDANLEAIAEYHTDGKPITIIKASGEISVEDMIKVIKDDGWEIYDVIQTTADGRRIHYNV